MTYIWIYVTIGIYYLQVATSQRNNGDNRKPGRCPAVPPDPKGTCVDLPICSVDSDCYGVKKCCPNGCGHECLFPVDPKPGICPPSGGGHCAEHCSKDSDCQDVQKCCSNGCGHDCFFPVTVKPGTCQTLPPDTVGTCVDLCTVDSDCLGDQKCCSHGCGHSCSSPVTVCPPEPKCPVPPNGPPGTCKPQCKFEYNVINGLRCRVKCVIGPQGPQGPPCPPTGCPGAGIPEPPAAQQGFSGAILGGERTKPGTCPVFPPGSGGTCVEKCRTDSDCPWKLKCCSSGCGHICQYPGPIPTCAPACDKSCPFGFVLDENNCPICECKTGCIGNSEPLFPPVNCAEGPRCPSSYQCVINREGTFGECCPVVCPTFYSTPESYRNSIGPFSNSIYTECPQLLCLIPCPHGFKVDKNGCQTCQCLPACPKAICHRPCEYGFIYDSTGCQTCDCRKRSCPQRLCPWGCPKEYKLGKDSCQTCDCRRGIPCPQEPICPLPNSPHPSCPGPCIYQNRILDGITCRVNCFRGLPPLPGRPGDPCPPTGCPGKPTGAAVQHDFPLNPPGTPPGNCPVGLPLPGFNCGLIPNPDKCPAGSFCNVDPMDRFGVCCLDRRCPVDQGSYFHCYGHYHRYCKDDSSCPKGKKCCKQGCSYKCVDAV